MVDLEMAMELAIATERLGWSKKKDHMKGEFSLNIFREVIEF